MNFLIIGGDAAGMSAASRAKRLDPSLAVTVLEKTRDVSYSACNMPYNIADAKRSMEDLVVRKADEFRDKQGIDIRLGHKAVRIDTVHRTVSGLADESTAFQLPYDRLLIATGASPVLPMLPGFDLPGVMVLKSLADGKAVKAYLAAHEVKNAVIIGMGYIALEMCEALRALDITVEMVKPRKDLLPWLARDLAYCVEQELNAHGIRLHMEQPVERIERSGDRLAVLGDGLALKADLVLVAVGVRPNSKLASDAGLQLGPSASIAVDRQMRTSAPDVYAGGDCADAFHVVSGQRVWIPLALRANRAGWAAADHICGREVALPGVAGTAVFKAFDMQVARTGLNASEAAAAGFETESVTIKSQSRSHVYPGGSEMRVHMVADRTDGRLLGVQMVGRESAAHRINAAVVALHARMTVPEFVQCDLAYAPPFGGVWDPLLIAANQLSKKL